MVDSIFGLTGVVIEDDLFLARKVPDLKEFVQSYNQHIDLPISITGITPNLLNERVVDVLTGLPLQSLRIGIESMSETGLELYMRQAPNKNLEINCTNLKKLPRYVSVNYDIILDNPYETDDDYVTTLNVCMGLPKPYNLNLYHLTFYEGTDIREKAIKDGVITADDMTHLDRRYGALDDTYINAIYSLLKAARGYVPRGVVRFLARPKLRDSKFADAGLKPVLKTMTLALDTVKFPAWVRRFHIVMSGTVGIRQIVDALLPGRSIGNWRASGVQSTLPQREMHDAVN